MDVSGDTLGWMIEDCYCVGGKGFMVRWRTGIVLGQSALARIPLMMNTLTSSDHRRTQV